MQDSVVFTFSSVDTTARNQHLFWSEKKKTGADRPVILENSRLTGFFLVAVVPSQTGTLQGERCRSSELLHSAGSSTLTDVDVDIWIRLLKMCCDEAALCDDGLVDGPSASTQPCSDVHSEHLSRSLASSPFSFSLQPENVCVACEEVLFPLRWTTQETPSTRCWGGRRTC